MGLSPKASKKICHTMVVAFHGFFPVTTSMIKDPKLKQSCCEVQLSLSTSSAQRKKKHFKILA
jgi:hypothetical protein